MKKVAIFIAVVMVAGFVSAAIADQHHGDEEKAGTLFLFQKCDDSLKGASGFDSSGCPNIGTGPWPIFPNNQRSAKLDYALWGKTFKFSFEGKRLLPKRNYTLIYYPDPWPGAGLICLGSGKTNPAGNLEIHGSPDIGTSLPASYDANFNPISPSGAVGAKIWSVLSEDVQCTSGASKMLNWNPTAYLFEYNLIVFEHREVNVDEHDEDDED